MKALLFLAAAAACAVSTPDGTAITNVEIVDGTGAARFRGTVRIVADTIAAVGANVTAQRGDVVVDGSGLVLAPGFIDTHSHHIGGLFEQGDALPVVSQGVTTVVGGQDGGHVMPLAATMDSLVRLRMAPNVAFYAGHGTIRRAVLGDDYRRVATAAEIDSMRVLLNREMLGGALGLSTGLEYDPGIYSSRAEVLALAKEAAAHKGRYISHIRSEDRWFWDAVDEVITIGKEAGLPVQISHAKLAMVSLWGQSGRLLATLDSARAQGIDITADIYPYPYWQSSLTVLFPKRDFANRREAELVLRDIARPEGLLIGDFDPDTSYEGKTVAQIAVMRGEAPATTLMALIRDARAYETLHPDESAESVVATSMDEPDIAAIMNWEHTNICSDGSMNGAHPRGYGAFPRVLARYVGAGKPLSLEGAVRKMTSLSAQHMGITRRGTIAAGHYADLVLFDAKTVSDRATPKDPHLVSVGISRVWVNGRQVWSESKTTGERPGRVLKRGAAS